MIRREELIKIGQFNKPHGVRGELSFTFTDDVFDRGESPYIVCCIDNIFVPFFIEEYRFKTGTTALIKLVDVESDEAARDFTNLEVFYPKTYYVENDEEATPDDYFIGFTINDITHGALGEVTAIDDSTINVLFVVTTPDDRELLIPVQEAFVRAIDEEERIIHMDLPDGLLDM
ncbi:MAG: 16S rRNA processing protein RimM [Bacteroidaceae bacterium]|jgi:16S rRNA processing protein RimM|nr:16S rRNA processing protein RimM [Bacteroidaceae bacterium]